MPVDLSGAQARIPERILLDRVTIRRDPITRSRDVDDDTGIPLPNPADDATVLATSVPAMTREANLREQEASTVTTKLYVVNLAFTAPDSIEVGDALTYTTAQDPALAGVTLYVSRVYAGTLRVMRRVEATRKRDDASQH